MVTFGNITDRVLTVTYTKEDTTGCKVTGSATYNKDNRLDNASGTIFDQNGQQVAHFNSYGEGEYARINLTDCMTDRMAEAAAVANETLADLAKGYKEE